MPSYTPTTWVEGVTTLGPTNMNKIENGIAAATATRQVNFAQITANATITATSEGTAQTVISGSAATYDGGGFIFEVACPFVDNDTVNAYTYLVLFEGASALGRLASFRAPTVGAGTGLHGAAQLFPSAGSHTYTLKSYVTAGTATIYAGAGGSGGFMPAFLRITSA